MVLHFVVVEGTSVRDFGIKQETVNLDGSEGTDLIASVVI